MNELETTIASLKQRVAELEESLADMIRHVGIGSTALPDVEPPESGTVDRELERLQQLHDAATVVISTLVDLCRCGVSAKLAAAEKAMVDYFKLEIELKQKGSQ